MEITILGSGTCDPSVERGCAGYLLKLLGKTFLIDAGPGTYRQLNRMEIPFTDIDAFFITHFHIDHINDLTAILFSLKNCASDKPKRDVVIHGTEGFAEKWESLLNVYGRWIVSEEYQIKVAEHGEDEFKESGVKIITLPMEHGEACVGFRFDDRHGKTIAYSGDTSACDNIVKLAAGCDALVMECTAPDTIPKEGHCSTSQAAEVAKSAGVKTLILSHISPENDTTDLEQRAARFFDGNIIPARDGMAITI